MRPTNSNGMDSRAKILNGFSVAAEPDSIYRTRFRTKATLAGPIHGWKSMCPNKRHSFFPEPMPNLYRTLGRNAELWCGGWQRLADSGPLGVADGGSDPGAAIGPRRHTAVPRRGSSPPGADYTPRAGRTSC